MKQAEKQNYFVLKIVVSKFVINYYNTATCSHAPLDMMVLAQTKHLNLSYNP